jgi:hypothetical protein
MLCSRCGKDNTNDVMLCTSCGSILTSRPQQTIIRPVTGRAALSQKAVIGGALGFLCLAVIISISRTGPYGASTQDQPTSRTTIGNEQPETKVTKSNFEKLENGIALKQATDILGPIAKIRFESKDKSDSAGVYEWGNDKIGFIICTFQNDKMISKSQISLKY